MQVTSSRSMVAENSELLATSLPEAPSLLAPGMALRAPRRIPLPILVCLFHVLVQGKEMYFSEVQVQATT